MLRFVRVMKLTPNAEFEAATRSAGELYSRAMFDYWRAYRKHGVQLPAQQGLMRLHPSAAGLHSHTCDAVISDFF